MNTPLVMNSGIALTMRSFERSYVAPEEMRSGRESSKHIIDELGIIYYILCIYGVHTDVMHLYGRLQLTPKIIQDDVALWCSVLILIQVVYVFLAA